MISFLQNPKKKSILAITSKIAGSCNVKTEKPFVFFDECEGILRFGINNHNTQEDNIIDPNVVTAVNEILNQLLNNPKLDITSLENLINKINLTITKQNETKELWNVQVTNDNQMDITDVVKFTGDLNENFENYYNSEL